MTLSPPETVESRLRAYASSLPRAARIFTTDLSVVWDNADNRLQDFPLYKDEDGKAVSVPPVGEDRNAWPVQRALRGDEWAMRRYWVEFDPPETSKCFQVTAWRLNSEQGQASCVIEETERVDSTRCHDETLKRLDAQLGELINCLAQFIAGDNEQDFLSIRLENRNLQPCYQIRDCKQEACPSQQEGANPRCWEASDTPCPTMPVPQNQLDKFRFCSQCKVFLMSCPDPLTRVGENINRLLSLLQIKHQETLAAYQRMQQAEKLGAIGELAMGIAHEVKTPLSVIMGRLDCLMLEIDSLSEEELRSDLAVMKQHAERMRKNLESLMTLARPQPVKMKRCRLSDIVRSTLPMIHKTMESAGIRIRTRFEERTPSIQADPAQVQQVLVNLALNARDAMPDGGTLTFQGRCAKQDPPAAILSVSDTGSGIPPKEQERLFSLFSTTKGDQGGAGLGLAVCKRIMERHQGRIEVASALGEGATFHLWFPLARRQSAKAGES